MTLIARKPQADLIRGLKAAGALPGWLDPEGDVTFTQGDDGTWEVHTEQEAPAEAPAEDE